MMALFPSTLKLGKRAWETAFALESGPERKVTLEFVAHRLAEALPIIDTDEDGKSGLAFTGTPQSISFIAPVSSGPNGGGLYRMAIAVRPANDNSPTSLELRISPFVRGTSGTNAPVAEEARRLADDLQSLQIRYFGAVSASEKASWNTEWSSPSQLPELVEFIIVSRDPEQAVVAPLRVELRLRTHG